MSYILNCPNSIMKVICPNKECDGGEGRCSHFGWHDFIPIDQFDHGCDSPCQHDNHVCVSLKDIRKEKLEKINNVKNRG